jgi:hypothetical protein
MRKAPRRRIFKGAVIAFHDRLLTIACTVRDLSETGARLQVLGSIEAPDTFVLIISKPTAEW